MEKCQIYLKIYIENYINTLNFILIKCPYCGSYHIIRWGTYPRTVIYIDDCKLVCKTIDIQRFMCKDCNKTHSLLPEGIIPYKTHAIDIIMEVLSNKDNNEMSIKNYINYETEKKWRKQFNKFFPFLATMFNTQNKELIFSKINENILNFLNDYKKEYNICFMQIRLLSKDTT